MFIVNAEIYGSTRIKLVDYGSRVVSGEAKVYRIKATGILIKGWYHWRYQPNAVWRHHGARVALLRWTIPRDGRGIIPMYAGGLKR